jgi:hypothetical protein
MHLQAEARAAAHAADAEIMRLQLERLHQVRVWGTLNPN